MGNEFSGISDIENLRESFRAYGQNHVFRFWDELDNGARALLCEQASGIDLSSLALAHARIVEAQSDGDVQLEPVQVERTLDHGGDLAASRAARQRGDELLAAGRVALMVVAGGQGTRLGFDGPKGAFPIGPVTNRSLFEVQAQKIRRLRRRYGSSMPWYVMTSSVTDAPTREFFARHNHFGMPPDDFFFFQQGMVPSLDFEGRLFLERPDHIFENPDGHGGSLTALLESGALDDMSRRGINTIFYYQVDNPLVRIGDPVYLGLHDAAGAEMSCKVVQKLSPEENVGVVVQLNGRIGMVEYTELEDEHRFARDDNGDLLYWTGNIAIHVFDTKFVRRVASAADDLLPYHASAKKIPHIDVEGRPLAPDAPNGHKLERFVFDALGAAGSVCIVEADRIDEFSPVKNADGADSPISARRDLSAQYRGWLESANIEVPKSRAIEIDHSIVDGPEDARALGIRSLEEVGDIILTASGAEQ